jgi:hypothetical protein
MVVAIGPRIAPYVERSADSYRWEFATAHAQTVGMPGGGGNAGSEKTRPSGGATADLYRSGVNQQQGSSSFDASKYMTKTDCVNVASLKGVSLSLCDSRK